MKRLPPLLVMRMIRKRHIMAMFFTYLYTYGLYFFPIFSFVIYNIGGVFEM
ncbi:hypothetical protein HanPSC8_Chr04g0141121 [Helianthus annuus]|nr:hypothetical protein HanPSC8_Chr04g0141121 [Helianthus annuus]